MKALSILWQFARPHTIIGTVISISTLYAMACHGDELQHIPLLLMAILCGIACNIYIVGINQIEDVALDRINKPFLPMASGALSLRNANIIVYSSMAIALLLAGLLSPYLVLIVGVSMAIGWAYSRPPLYLRKHHLPAAISIALVRGVMVNVGGFSIFNRLINGSYALSTDVQILTLFIVAFTVVIAWFKDLPDMKGDSAFHIRSLAILYSPRFTVLAGNILVSAAYLCSIWYYGSAWKANAAIENGVLFYGHLLLLSAFIANTVLSRKTEQAELRRYYKRFWLFFFAEYLLYLPLNLS